MLYFQWKEHEGPAVTQTSQKGFGSSLIASTVEMELHGKAETKIEPDGLYFFAFVSNRQSANRLILPQMEGCF